MPQAVRNKTPKREKIHKPTKNKVKNQPYKPPAIVTEFYYRETVLFSFLFIALYLFISLLSYNPLDVGWGNDQTAANIQNIGGSLGAVFADNFFNWFGYFAYLFSFMVAYTGWALYQSKHLDLLQNPKKLLMPGIGFILTLSAGCGLAIVHFAAESILLPSHAGGVLGNWVGNGLKNVINSFGATLVLLVLFFAGFSMMTKLSWLNIMDRLGATTLQWLPIIWQQFQENWLPKFIYYSKLSWHWLHVNFRIIWQQTKHKSQLLYNNWQIYQQKRHEKQIEKQNEAAQQSLINAEKLNAENLNDIEISTYKPLIKTTVEQDTQAIKIPATMPAINSKILEKIIENQLVDIFLQLNIAAHIRYIQTGPSLLHIELQSEEGQAHKLLSQQSQIAMQLDIAQIRLYETAPEQIVLEIPNPEPENIDLDLLLQQKMYINNKAVLMLALGKDISGHAVIIDLARIPHLLLAGQHRFDMDLILDNIILSLIHKNSATQVRLLLLDSIDNNFEYYNDIPHLLSPIVSYDNTDYHLIFNWCVQEMERRYELMDTQNVPNIEKYNHKIGYKRSANLPYIVIIVHEIESLWQNPEAENINHLMTDLARKARSAGIHMILATANPNPTVINPQMKINFPSRIIAQLDNKTASQHLLGRSGAEYLLGEGDMFYLTPSTTGMPARLHAAYIEDKKADAILATARALGQPQYQNLSATVSD